MKRIRTVFTLMLIAFSILGVTGLASDWNNLAFSNSDFAIRLYSLLSRQTEENIFFSPYSISSALAMTYAGARGNTEAEMAQTLSFQLGQEKLHPAFSKFKEVINNLQTTENVELNVANAIWTQKESPLLPEYLNLLKQYYDSSVTSVDFKNSSDSVRTQINEWVEQKTNDKIQELFPPGSISASTRLALVNAIYFKADWKYQFEKKWTDEKPFYVSPEETIQAPLMFQEGDFKYAEVDGMQILELPYAGESLSMIIFLPNNNQSLETIEALMSVDKIYRLKSSLSRYTVRVYLPKFKMTRTLSLSGILQSMGMKDAFNESLADFSGIDGRKGSLFLEQLLHKAFVDVGEQGTEAAAATGGTIGITSIGSTPPIKPKIFRADHPFFFLILERNTDSILFMGRVKNPNTDKETETLSEPVEENFKQDKPDSTAENTVPIKGEMVLVKAGTFQMGDEYGDLWEGCRPVHTVKLTYDYYIGKYEVTFNEYDAYCEAAGKEKPTDYSSWAGYDMGRGNKPVINVTWWDAIAYCNWLSEKEGLSKAYDSRGNLLDKNGRQTTDITKVEGYRLPTEAEWEYAARGGHKSTGDYKYAGSNNLKEVGWYWGNSGSKTHEVGQKAPNELGLYDMSGNVWEWCHDWYEDDYYDKSQPENPVNLNSASNRVVRGGSWKRYAKLCRVAIRDLNDPVSSFYNGGLRIARTRK